MLRKHQKNYYGWGGSCDYTFNTKGWNDSCPDNYVTLATLSIPTGLQPLSNTACADMNLVYSITIGMVIAGGSFTLLSGSQGDATGDRIYLTVNDTRADFVGGAFQTDGYCARTTLSNTNATSIKIQYNVNALQGSGLSTSFTAGRARIYFHYSVKMLCEKYYNVPEAGDLVKSWCFESSGLAAIAPGLAYGQGNHISGQLSSNVFLTSIQGGTSYYTGSSGSKVNAIAPSIANDIVSKQNSQYPTSWAFQYPLKYSQQDF